MCGLFNQLASHGSNLRIEGGAVQLVVWHLLTAQDLRQFDHYSGVCSLLWLISVIGCQVRCTSVQTLLSHLQ